MSPGRFLGGRRKLASCKLRSFLKKGHSRLFVPLPIRDELSNRFAQVKECGRTDGGLTDGTANGLLSRGRFGCVGEVFSPCRYLALFKSFLWCPYGVLILSLIVYQLSKYQREKTLFRLDAAV